MRQPRPGMTQNGGAQDEGYEQNEERYTRPQAKPRVPVQPRYDYTGQVIPPLARGWKRSSCTWSPQFGWVFTPTWKQWS